jgi:predicted transcriptional regulator
MAGTSWTDKEVQQLTERYEAGDHVADIANDLGRNHAAVKKKICNLNLTRKRRRSVTAGVSDNDIITVLEENKGNREATARQLGLKPATLKDRIAKMDIQTLESKWSAEQNGDSMLINAKGDEIRTVEDAIRKSGVDRQFWQVHRVRVGGSDVTMKIRQNDGTDRPMTVQNQNIRVEMKRIVPSVIENTYDALIEQMKKYTPKLPKVPRQKITAPHMLEVCPYDVHFGKLAWAAETGENYDLKIADRAFRAAIDWIILNSSHYQFDRIVMPVGQDLLHIDNFKNTTANDTPQDVDGRLQKIFLTATRAMVDAVHSLRQIAPVELIYSASNHDRMTSWFLSAYIDAVFAGVDDVTVDLSPRSRKYIEYGSSMVCFAHGDQEKPKEFPQIIATEQPHMWARSQHREVHLGHFHKVKEMVFTTADSFQSVVVRYIPALSGTDRWHHDKGYVGGGSCVTAFTWHHEHGIVGIMFSPRESYAA